MEIFLQIWEWLGVVSALIYVYLASKAKRSCFIFGLISSVIFVQICFSEKLYFDTTINTYYVIMSVVGWISWNPKIKTQTISHMNFKIFLMIMVATVLCAGILGYLASTYSDQQLPYFDAFTTTTAIVATWMMVRKIIQNWLIWIVSNGVAIYLYYAKDHLPMAFLFLVYTVISIYGYLQWRRMEAGS